MILISHRGNVNGKIEDSENNPSYIDSTLNKNFEVEIDFWIIDNNLFLGHDKPQYKIDLDWLLERSNKLWIHCKNVEAITYLQSKNESSLNYFWHENDTLTLTSNGSIWAYPGKQPIKNSIAVMPENFNDCLNVCLGICSDFIENYKI